VFLIRTGYGKVIVVDDNSPDGTSAQADLLSREFNVALIKREKSGLGSAYIAGFRESLRSSDVVLRWTSIFLTTPRK
jgi:glycosyltransferase involved in cell wall biosynthesis